MLATILTIQTFDFHYKETVIDIVKRGYMSFMIKTNLNKIHKFKYGKLTSAICITFIYFLHTHKNKNIDNIEREQVQQLVLTVSK